MDDKQLIINGVKVAQALIADTFATRLRGMLFRRQLPPAMLISPTKAVHGMGMTRSLDVAFIDASGTVLKIATLRPFGFVAAQAACAALEAPSGNFVEWNLTEGDTVEIR